MRTTFGGLGPVDYRMAFVFYKISGGAKDHGIPGVIRMSANKLFFWQETNADAIAKAKTALAQEIFM